MSLELLTLLPQMQNAIGNALSLEQQLFVSANYPSIMKFLNSDAGRQAIRNFIEEWETAPEEKPH